MLAMRLGEAGASDVAPDDMAGGGGEVAALIGRDLRPSENLRHADDPPAPSVSFVARCRTFAHQSSTDVGTTQECRVSRRPRDVSNQALFTTSATDGLTGSACLARQRAL